MSKLKGKMLQKGNDGSKRYPSLQKIKGKRALPSGNTPLREIHIIIVIRAPVFSGMNFSLRFGGEGSFHP